MLDCKRKEIIIRLPITVNCKPGFDTLDELFVQDGNWGECDIVAAIQKRIHLIIATKIISESMTDSESDCFHKGEKRTMLCVLI